MTLNARTVNVKITRLELCDLLLACTALDNETPADTQKWGKLHDKLKNILDEFDQKQKI